MRRIAVRMLCVLLICATAFASVACSIAPGVRPQGGTTSTTESSTMGFATDNGAKYLCIGADSDATGRG